MEEMHRRARAKLSDIERKHILATLTLCDGNRTRAAEMLGISLRCLRNKLHLYIEEGLRVPEPKLGRRRSGPTQSPNS